ncbi:hypothetical protein AB0W38_00480 [Aliarcobacter butzleri]|uniref:DUF2958 domain-containing protein n=1 Tax=Aliarcobacter butzleri TaxID=28197 RepID=UPI00344D10EA
MKIFKEEDLKNIPELYSQDGKGDKAVVHIVVNIPGTEYFWLLTEYSEEEQLFYGFACLADTQNAELGYISKIELEELADNYPLKIEKVEISLKNAKTKYIFKED